MAGRARSTAGRAVVALLTRPQRRRSGPIPGRVPAMVRGNDRRSLRPGLRDPKALRFPAGGTIEERPAPKATGSHVTAEKKKKRYGLPRKGEADGWSFSQTGAAVRSSGRSAHLVGHFAPPRAPPAPGKHVRPRPRISRAVEACHRARIRTQPRASLAPARERGARRRWPRLHRREMARQGHFRPHVLHFFFGRKRRGDRLDPAGRGLHAKAAARNIGLSGQPGTPLPPTKRIESSPCPSSQKPARFRRFFRVSVTSDPGPVELGPTAAKGHLLTDPPLHLSCMFRLSLSPLLPTWVHFSSPPPSLSLCYPINPNLYHSTNPLLLYLPRPRFHPPYLTISEKPPKPLTSLLSPYGCSRVPVRGIPRPGSRGFLPRPSRSWCGARNCASAARAGRKQRTRRARKGIQRAAFRGAGPSPARSKETTGPPSRSLAQGRPASRERARRGDLQSSAHPDQDRASKENGGRRSWTTVGRGGLCTRALRPTTLDPALWVLIALQR